MIENLPVFVYGTLRHGHGNYRGILAGNTEREAEATIDGAVMTTNGGFPYVYFDDEDGGTVYGELMWLRASNIDDTMRRLDRLEGYRADNPEFSLYLRVKVTVTVSETGEQVEAWMYTPSGGKNSRAANLPRVVTGDWNNQKKVNFV